MGGDGVDRGGHEDQSRRLAGYMAAAGRKAKNEQEVGLQSCHQRPTFSSEILAPKRSKSFPKPQWLGNKRLYTQVCFSHANHNTFLNFFAVFDIFDIFTT